MYGLFKMMMKWCGARYLQSKSAILHLCKVCNGRVSSAQSPRATRSEQTELTELATVAFPLHLSSLTSHRTRAASSSSSSLSQELKLRINMSSAPLPSPIHDPIVVVGLGMLSVDFLATVASYPKPDDKIRSTSLKVEGGGNSGNALTCVARLGLTARLISKVVDDYHGRSILEELESDGVDTSYIAVSKEGNSPFSYIIVDNQTKTRTCIHTPLDPPMVPSDISRSSLLSVLDGAGIMYFDGRSPETALIVAQECVSKGIPILVEAERLRGEGFDDLLEFADYTVCSAKFPQAWTNAASVGGALVSMMLRLPKLKFVIVTLGEDGCIMLERSSSIIDDTILFDKEQEEVIDVDSLLDKLKETDAGAVTSLPKCISSSKRKLKADGVVGTVSGRLMVGTAEKIPPPELVDTTGAGDAFIGATLFAICTNMPPEKMLRFAAQVAAANCRALGARSGLPYRFDPRIASFL